MDATDKTDAAWHWREAGNGGGGCYPEHPEAGEKGFILARCPKEEHDAGLCPEMQGDTYETTMAQDAAGDFNLVRPHRPLSTAIATAALHSGG